MRHHWAPPLLAAGFGLFVLHGAHAAGQGPLVIPGVGPEQHYAPAPAPVRQPQRFAAGGGYGGGFIELLVTGRDPTHAHRQASPRQEYRQPYPPQQYQQGYSQPVTPNLGFRPAPMPHVEDAQSRVRAPAMAPVTPRAQPIAYAPQAAESASPVRRAIDAQFQRQEVDYKGPHAPGTIVVDTPRRHLYFVEGNGRATRYGIGVGRPGFEWAGVKAVTRKAEWPAWVPPPEMLLRRPELPRRMEGGPDNPLGARALYLGSTLYRIHGTNEPHTIGQNVSSGCIRMMNEDVTELYEKVRVGTKVVVM